MTNTASTIAELSDAVSEDTESTVVPAASIVASAPLIPTWLAQLIKYGGVACIALATDLIVLTLGVEVWGFPVPLAAAIAFCCGLTVNYLLCIQWVFDQRTLENRRLEFAMFALVGVLGLAITEVILLVGVEVLAYSYRPAKLFAVAVVFFWNFTARKMLLFTRRK